MEPDFPKAGDGRFVRRPIACYERSPVSCDTELMEWPEHTGAIGGYVLGRTTPLHYGLLLHHTAETSLCPSTFERLPHAHTPMSDIMGAKLIKLNKRRQDVSRPEKIMAPF